MWDWMDLICRGCPVYSIGGEIQGSHSVPLLFKKSNNFIPTPCSMPKSMYQYKVLLSSFSFLINLTENKKKHSDHFIVWFHDCFKVLIRKPKEENKREQQRLLKFWDFSTCAWIETSISSNKHRTTGVLVHCSTILTVGRTDTILQWPTLLWELIEYSLSIYSWRKR